jgi:regulator of extracellular matrix RemA (YlzA/DUF370 family)
MCIAQDEPGGHGNVNSEGRVLAMASPSFSPIKLRGRKILEKTLACELVL